MIKEITSYPTIHYVYDCENMPFGINAHTHGLKEYGNLELECVLPFHEKDMQMLLNALANIVVSDSGKLTEGCYTGILADNYRIAFIEKPDSFDGNEKILRVIYPDESGKMPWEEGCDKTYVEQFNDISCDLLDHFINDVVYGWGEHESE